MKTSQLLHQTISHQTNNLKVTSNVQVRWICIHFKSDSIYSPRIEHPNLTKHKFLYDLSASNLASWCTIRVLLQHAPVLVFGVAKFRQSRPDEVVFKSSSNYRCPCFRRRRSSSKGHDAQLYERKGQRSWPLRSRGNFERVIPERCAVVVHERSAFVARTWNSRWTNYRRRIVKVSQEEPESDARASPESENSLPRENASPLRVKVETILRMKYTNSPRWTRTTTSMEITLDSLSLSLSLSLSTPRSAWGGNN